MENCLICGFQSKITNGFSRHLSIIHNVSRKDYVIQFQYNGVHPVCACGCGEKVGFSGSRFSKFKNKHSLKTQEIKNKRNKTYTETCMKKYNVCHPMKLRIKPKIRKEKLTRKIKKDKLEKYCENKKYIPLFDYSIYKNNRQQLDFKCLMHNEIFKSNMFKIQRKDNQCPKCRLIGISKPELELNEYLKNQFPETQIKRNTRSVISPYELDFFFPDLNFAIEYNGMYWHSFEKTKIKDRKKREMCKNLGIKLYQINEKSWLKNKEKVKIRLINFIHNTYSVRRIEN